MLPLRNIIIYNNKVKSICKEMNRKFSNRLHIIVNDYIFD